jgi:hypothetical protein
MSERDLILDFTDRELEQEHRLNSESQNQPPPPPPPFIFQDQSFILILRVLYSFIHAFQKKKLLQKNDKIKYNNIYLHLSNTCVVNN